MSSNRDFAFLRCVDDAQRILTMTLIHEHEGAIAPMKIVSFGPIDSFEAFRKALHDLAAFATSENFGDEAFADALRRELAAIRAWTAARRTPQLSERLAVRLGSLIRDASENLAPQTAEVDASLDLAANLGWFFANWPPSDELARTRGFLGDGVWDAKRPRPRPSFGTRQ